MELKYIHAIQLVDNLTCLKRICQRLFQIRCKLSGLVGSPQFVNNANNIIRANGTG